MIWISVKDLSLLITNFATTFTFLFQKNKKP